MHYRKLAIALSINFVAMYFITYAMIDTVDHFHFNVNRVWMAMMMVAPMVIVMLIVMRSMFENRRRNLLLHVVFAALFVACFLFARKQVLVDDPQFLRSMIPHHSSAILMCQEATITDPEITKLCEKIIESQKQEIAQMKEILARY